MYITLLGTVQKIIFQEINIILLYFHFTQNLKQHFLRMQANIMIFKIDILDYTNQHEVQKTY